MFKESILTQDPNESLLKELDHILSELIEYNFSHADDGNLHAELHGCLKNVHVYVECLSTGKAETNFLKQTLSKITQGIRSIILMFKRVGYEGGKFQEVSIRLETIANELANPTKVGTTNKSLTEADTVMIRKIAKESTELLLSEHREKVNELSLQTRNAGKDYVAMLLKMEEQSEEQFKEFNEKLGQLDTMLSHASGRVIAGDFEQSAIDERKMANRLRYGSLFCMFLIIVVIGWTFYETTLESFQWQNSIVRITLAIMLSVPAAYLARESAKHREQQYNHLQTSLDLKAMTPYLATLPEAEQHKIKSEMANRIFASRDFSKVSRDPYPINTQEIIMGILNKVEIPKAKEETTTK